MSKLYEKRTINAYTDTELESLANCGKLFRIGTFNPEAAQGVSYDLRAADELISRNRGRKYSTLDGFSIEPGEVITVETIESLDLSNPLSFALIASNHTDVSRGLHHPFTIVDPGYQGVLALTLINSGNAPVTIAKGDRVAKLIVIPLSSIPQKVYGVSKAPKVRQGSLDHALIAEGPSFKTTGDEEEARFAGGSLGRLISRVSKLEQTMDSIAVKSQLKAIGSLSQGCWFILGGIFVGFVYSLVIKYWDSIWIWIKSLF